MGVALVLAAVLLVPLVVRALLPRVVVVAAAGKVPGFDRLCSPGHACSFGSAWTDDVDVELGRDGCDTRNGILARDLQQPVFKPGPHRCVVIGGWLVDPYSGQLVELAAGAVEIDHVFPLSVAWDRGAAEWSLQRRKDFANDPTNLLATATISNQAKRAKMPNQWHPATHPGRCLYASRFVEVARRYQLKITVTEAAAVVIDHIGCPSP